MRLKLAAAIACIALAACGSNQPTDEPTPQPEGTPDAEATASIFSPNAGTPEPAVELAPLVTRIPFAEGGADLSEEALAELATVRQSPQLAEGGRVILRGHSDAGGSDAANIRASTARAEEVRDWLVEMGVAEDRITVIAFGEQNPVQPNALPNGEPNENGRQANRRVDVTVELPRAGASQDKPGNPDAASGEEASG